jgi:hypothetical protein
LSKELTILHYNILEKYPPAMNLITDVLTQKPDYKISVITSLNSSSYKKRKYVGVKIFRLGSVSENVIFRYSSYLIYNLIGAIILFIKRPNIVIIYESLSIFPACIYSSVFSKKKIHVHFHEYISLQEKESASNYMKFLFRCEEKLLKKCTISHTNTDRKDLFLKDNPNLKADRVAVYPNMPPPSWWTDFGKYKKPWNGGKIKLVYVGVLDIETMYLMEVLKWVKANSDELELTVFSHQMNNKTKEIINSFVSPNIKIKPSVNYYELPNELVKYDVGLVLYNGHIPNYVYNVPNKVYEYLNCGLQVIADNCLLSLKKKNNLGVIQISFDDIDNINFRELLNNRISTEHFSAYNLVDIL